MMNEEKNGVHGAPALAIDQLARWAGIRLTCAEREILSAQLQAAVAAATDALRPLDDIDIVLPGAANGLSGVYREDIPAPSLPREEALAAAPAQADGCFLVPRVIR